MNFRGFVERQQVIRQDMLTALYDARNRCISLDLPGFFRTLGFDPDECWFAWGYLLETGLIRMTGMACQITAAGIERFEKEWQ